MATVLDSPANNTRSKQEGPRLGKPKRMAVLQDAGQQANKKSKVARSGSDAKMEAAAERRRLMEEQKRADVAQKKADRDAAMAQRRAAREEASALGRTGSGGSGISRTGSGSSAGSARRTGSAEDKPSTATRKDGPRQPRRPAGGLPARNPYDYKNRLADLESMIAGMVRTDSSGSDSGATGAENAPQVLQSNVNALTEKHAAAAAQVAELQEKLQQAEDSKAEQVKSLEESKAAALESAEKSKQQELNQLRAETEAAAAAQTAQLAKLQAEFDSSTRDAEQLRTQLTSRESELSAMRSTVDTQAANLVAVKAQVDASATALQAEQAAHATTTARAVSAEETVAAREATIAQLEAKAKEDEKLRKKLHNTIQELKGNIRVFARVRPSPQETAADSGVQLFDINGSKSLVINDPNGRADSTGEIKARSIDFSYDHVFGPESRQEDVFEEISQLVQSALDGYKVCIFCYGQTGSGKTFTMQGPEGKEALSPGSKLAGMIPRSCEQIFATASELSECPATLPSAPAHPTLLNCLAGEILSGALSWSGADGWSFSVTGSFLEIYNESLFDLLGSSDTSSSREKLEIRLEKGKPHTHVPGLTTCAVESPAQVYELLERASACRSTAATAMNERSSRSHSVFQLKISGVNSESSEKVEGVLNLVDLAGSERLAQSQAEGERKKETLAINKVRSHVHTAHARAPSTKLRFQRHGWWTK